MHLYEVHTDRGVFDVETQHSHEDHNEKTFAAHLVDIIKGATSSIVGALVINRFIYKGRR